MVTGGGSAPGFEPSPTCRRRGAFLLLRGARMSGCEGNAPKWYPMIPRLIDDHSRIATKLKRQLIQTVLRQPVSSGSLAKEFSRRQQFGSKSAARLLSTSTSHRNEPVSRFASTPCQIRPTTKTETPLRCCATCYHDTRRSVSALD